SKECQVESFRVKGRPQLLGIKFDNHAAYLDDIGDFCAHDGAWLGAIGFKAAQVDELLRMGQEKRVHFERDFTLLFSNFCTML
ncbi:MAG: hypothetical protein PF495_13305, partial [Spirochaetales bacterium]|nr:hypothetical protein [Spirochaetales bacterium]